MTRALSAVVVAGALALFVPLFVPIATGRVFVNDDLANLHLPLRFLYQQALTEGHSSLWTPAFFSGTYLLAEGQAGTAHPLHVVAYRVLPLDVALNLEVIANYAASFVGALLLLRRLALARDAAMVGAAIFTFGGFSLARLVHLNMLAVLAHVPWVLLSAHQVLFGRSARTRAIATAGVALLVGSQLLLGFPQSVWLSFLVLGLFTLLFVPLVPDAARLTRLAWLAAAACLGIMLGGAQLIPSLDAAARSVRATTTADFRTSISLHPANIIQLWSPYAFAGGTYSPDDPAHEFIFYAGGVASVSLAWLAARWRAIPHRRVAGGLLALALVGLVLALGRFAGVYTILSQLPGLYSLRAPARHVFLVHLALAGIAAVALDDLLRLQGRDERLPMPRLVLLAIPVVLSAITVVAVTALDGVADAGTFRRLPALASGIALMAVPALLMAGAARGWRAALPLIVGFVVLDLGVYGYRQVWLEPPQPMATVASWADVPPGAAPGDKVVTKAGDTHANLAVLHGLRLTGGYLGLYPQTTHLPDSPEHYRAAGASWLRAEGTWKALAGVVPRARLERNGSDGQRLTGEGQARVLVDQPGRIVVDVATPGPQLLVLTERFDEGWTALANGRPCPTLRVHGDFLACRLTPEVQRVELRFEPWSATMGRRVSALGLVLTLLAAILAARQQGTHADLSARARP